MTTETIRLSLPPTDVGPMLARAGARPLLVRLTGDQAFDLELLITEITTNAVRQQGTDAVEDITLTIERGPRTMRVEASYLGTPLDPDGRGATSDEARFGLAILDALTDAWGVERRGARTVVWFEAETRPYLALGPEDVGETA